MTQLRAMHFGLVISVLAVQQHQRLIRLLPPAAAEPWMHSYIFATLQLHSTITELNKAPVCLSHVAELRE